MCNDFSRINSGGKAVDHETLGFGGCCHLSAGYLALRLLNAEAWDKDGNTHVLFPREPIALYYICRPMTYLDGALTGMRFHIGPHQ